MLKGKHILSRAKQAWILAVAFSLFTFSPAARGENVQALMGLSGFRTIVVAIARLNSAMRLASENPEDAFRRTAVQQAMAAMPPAILALAAEFREGTLHDDDLPHIQSLLGGFVDQSAPTAFDKFLKHPSKTLIPKVGANFPNVNVSAPTNSSGSNSSQQLTMDDSVNKFGNSGKAASAPTNGAAGNAYNAPDVSPTSPYGALANLNDASNSTVSGKPFTGLSMDENAPTSSGNKSSGGDGSWTPDAATSAVGLGAGIGGQNSSPTSTVSGGSNSGATGDNYNLTNSNLPGVDDVVTRKPASDDGFFKNPNSADDNADGNSDGSSIAQKKIKRAKRAIAPAADYQSPVVPKYWNVVPIRSFISLSSLSWAEGAPSGPTGPSGAAGKSAAGDDSGGGGSCMGGGAAGGGAAGGEGGGGGAKAAELLTGLAAVMFAAAPMVAAVIQSKSDIQIAQINAATQVQLSAMTQQTSIALAQQQAAIAANQSQTSLNIVNAQNSAANQRLQEQLQLVYQESQQANALQQQRDQALYSRQNQQIALAQQQETDQKTLAFQQLNAQKEAAGLYSGAAYAAGSGLSVNPVMASASSIPSINTGSVGSSFNGLSSGTGSTGSGTAVASNAGAASTIGGALSNFSGGIGSNGSTASATGAQNAKEILKGELVDPTNPTRKSGGASKLLAAVSKSKGSALKAFVADAGRITATNGAVVSGVPAGLKSILKSSLAQGSTKANKHVVADLGETQDLLTAARDRSSYSGNGSYPGNSHALNRSAAGVSGHGNGAAAVAAAGTSSNFKMEYENKRATTGSLAH